MLTTLRVVEVASASFSAAHTAGAPASGPIITNMLDSCFSKLAAISQRPPGEARPPPGSADATALPKATV
jgi:hypothetical protein